MRALRHLVVASLLLVGSASAVFAQGLTTMTVIDSTGAPRTYRVVQDASSRLSQTHALCDPTAGANAATNCVTVAGGAALVTGTGGTFPATQSGTWNVGTVTTITGGGVAAGATDSGNPHKVGGVYLSTLPTLTTGQRGDMQVNASGELRSLLTARTSTSVDAVASSIAFPVTTGTDTTANRPLAAAGYVFNGSTFDRMRGGAVADVAAATGFANGLAVGQYLATPPTLTDTRYNHVLLDSAGNLKVNVAAGGASGGTSSSFGAAVPATGTAAGYSDGTNMVLGRVGAVSNVAAATGIQQGLMVGQYLAAAPTLTDTRYQHALLDVNGNLKVNVAAGGASGGTSSSFAAAMPATGTAIGLYDGTNMVRARGDETNGLWVNVKSSTGPGQGDAGSGLTGSPVMGLVQTSPPTYTNGNVNLPSMSARGALWGAIDSWGQATLGAGSAFGTSPGTATSANANVSLFVGTTLVSATNPVASGFNLGGTATTPRTCQSVATYDASTSGNTELVSLTSGQTIRICSYVILTGTTATDVKFTYGTGTNCGTGTTDITPAFPLVANDKMGEVKMYWQGLATAAANALCINTSAGNAVKAIVYYNKAT